MSLIDATKLDSRDILRVAVNVEVAVGRYMRNDPYAARLDTMSIVIADERPTNAVERRQAAVACWQYKHLNRTTDRRAIYADLEAMRKMGRTARWEGAIMAAANAVYSPSYDLAWVLSQHSIYLNYAAM